MNPRSTSRETILETCRAIVRERGLSGVSVRSVASACGVAPGTLYNYFPGKEALVLAVTADVWSDILSFDAGKDKCDEKDFASHVERAFQSAQAGMARYPGFLPAHALGLTKERDQRSEGKEMMQTFIGRLESSMLSALESDNGVREDAFDDDLTKEGLAELVTQQLISLLVLGRGDCKALVAMIRKVLY